MKKTFMLTFFLLIGLIWSQIMPLLISKVPEWYIYGRHIFTMSLLAFIMIHVGQEFQIDLNNKKQYAVDYGIAVTAATFPWIFVSLYFLFYLIPPVSTINPPWVEALLVGRFAAPTSAGVLFTMLAASGLSNTWVYRKTRVLAIFDDLDTVLLMIPLQMLIVGFAWQLGGAIIAITVMLYIGIKYYRKISLPTTWPWVLGYSLLLVITTDWLYKITKTSSDSVGMHIEVLLPAFVIGCAFKESQNKFPIASEQIAALVVSCAFMLFVGISMPVAFGAESKIISSLDPLVLGFHVFAVTILSNVGKMFACFFYRSEASFKERLAVSIAMFPRGEVGAGILAVSLSYGVLGPHVTVAFMSLALNLIMTGVFIYIVKKLVAKNPMTSSD